MLEARKFCKLFPKRKANASEAKMAGDSGQLSEPQHKLASLRRVTIYTGGSQPGRVGTRRTLRLRPGLALCPGSRQHGPRPHACHARAHSARQPSAQGIHLGGGHVALGAHPASALVTPFALGHPSAARLCWGGLAPHPAGLPCDNGRKSLHLPGNPMSLLSTGQKPHSPPSRSEHP